MMTIMIMMMEKEADIMIMITLTHCKGLTIELPLHLTIIRIMMITIEISQKNCDYDDHDIAGGSSTPDKDHDDQNKCRETWVIMMMQ